MPEGKWETLDRYVVISSDAHAGADLRDYRPYLASRWHDEFDAWADNYISPFDDLVHATAVRNWTSDIRLKELEADGICAEILFPNTIPPFFPTVTTIAIGLPKSEEFERRWAGLQAHNRWMVDFCKEAPTRRRGLLQIFPNEVDLAVDEIKWAKETGVFGGVLLPAVPAGHSVPPLFHTKYEALWAVCEDLDLPLAHHTGTGNPEMPMDQPASHAVLITEMGDWARRTLCHLILGGVFERHARLKFVPTELSTGWALQMGKTLDARVAKMKKDSQNRTITIFGGEVIESLSLMPSEYIRRNCYYGASVLSDVEVDLRYELGVDHVMWGTDYPHEEGSTPQSREALRWAFWNVPEEECRLMLGGTAADVYGFDLDALTPIAMEIGPTLAEIHAPLDHGESGTWLGRPFDGGALLTRSRSATSSF